MRSRRRIQTAALVAACAVLAPAAALALTRAAITAGTCAGAARQHGRPAGAVHFSVSRNLRAVVGFSGEVSATCTRKGARQIVEIDLDPAQDMRIRKLKFGFHGVFAIDDGTVVIADHVDGTFARARTVTGTMSATWTFDTRAPRPFPGQHCVTGTARYIATRDLALTSTAPRVSTATQGQSGSAAGEHDLEPARSVHAFDALQLDVRGRRRA